MAWHEIREFRADGAILGEVRAMVAQAVEAGGFPLLFCNRLQIAVDEAVTNIIEHGYVGQPAELATFTVRIDCNPDEFRVEILDRGLRYDQPSTEELDIHRHVASGRTGGLGVFLMRRIMDEVDYHYETGSHNRLVMIKRRLSSSALAPADG